MNTFWEEMYIMNFISHSISFYSYIFSVNLFQLSLLFAL